MTVEKMEPETRNLPTPTAVKSLAKLIQDPNCQSIAVLTGAGVSETSELFPGMFASKMKQHLVTATPQQREVLESDPSKLVAWETFQENPLPYLEIRRPFVLGLKDDTSRATIAHRFMELLHVKTQKLTRVYTQNIDGLDDQCEGIPKDKIVHLRGTISKAACEGCKAEMDFEEFSSQIKEKIKDIYEVDDSAPPESSPILCKSCGLGLVKTKTVLFGRTPPDELFARSDEDLPGLDLLIVAGTSLLISPAGSLFDAVPDSTCRVLVNRTNHIFKDLRAERDFFAQEECDSFFLNLIEELGWMEDLLIMKDLLPERDQRLLASKTVQSMTGLFGFDQVTQQPEAENSSSFGCLLS